MPKRKSTIVTCEYFAVALNIMKIFAGYMNCFCHKIAECALKEEKSKYNLNGTIISELESYIKRKMIKSKAPATDNYENSLNYSLSLSHEICNLRSAIIERSLPCAFKKPLYSNVKELFILR